MAKTYNELDALVRKHSQLLHNIGVSITGIISDLDGKQDKLVYQVEDIKNIPQDICTALKVGDIVNKGNHSYRVTFKKNDEGMCLTYVDASRVETQSYDLTDGVWVYNSEDLIEFSNFSSVEVITPTGTEPTAQGLKIDGVDYKLGGGSEIHLYKHTLNISLYRANTSQPDFIGIIGCMYTTNDTPFTKDSLYEFMVENKPYTLLVTGIRGTTVDGVTTPDGLLNKIMINASSKVFASGPLLTELHSGDSSSFSTQIYTNNGSVFTIVSDKVYQIF